MKKQEESVLLYQFSDEAALAIQEVLRKLRIQASVLEPGAWHQRQTARSGSSSFERCGHCTYKVQGGDDAVQSALDARTTVPNHA